MSEFIHLPTGQRFPKWFWEQHCLTSGGGLGFFFDMLKHHKKVYEHDDSRMQYTRNAIEDYHLRYDKPYGYAWAVAKYIIVNVALLCAINWVTGGI